MRQTQHRAVSRLARAFGLLVVLGLPLAVTAPLDSGLQGRQEQASQSLAGSGTAASITAIGSPLLEGYVPATPRANRDAAGAIEIRHSARAGALPVTTIVNDPRCGTGFTLVEGGAGAFCVHTVPDRAPSAPFAAKAAGMAPACMGNGVNGARIQLIYMYVEGRPDRTGEVVPRIVNEIVPRMESVFRETSKAQGREIGMRLHMPDCKLTADTVMIDAENGESDDPGAMLNRIISTLRERGYDGTDRKYLVWFDGYSPGACGVAPADFWWMAPGVTDTAVTGNTSNVGWQERLRETAVAFEGMGRCWGRGGTGATTELHELIHLLGAVNVSAPNSNGTGGPPGSEGHCLDGIDIMCHVAPGGGQVVVRCNTPVEQLDCGSDDYFNTRPPAGSYLSTHWNVANSRFLGDAIIHDNVPVKLPRP